LVGALARLRGDDTPFEVVVEGPPGGDPAPWAAAGATWWLVEFSPFEVDAAAVRAVIAEGRPAGS
jgi:hypothetical protein